MAQVIKENLFTVLERGDRRIDLLCEKATILVGESRNGKSALFNLINGKPMIGQGVGMNTSYQLLTEDEDAARMSTRYKSETLEPNIRQFFSKDESLIDMAGFNDTRDYIGTIGVSYFLYQVFSKVKKARFILVITQTSMADPAGQKLISTFQGFINMFKIDLMPSEIKQQLKNSLSLVVTKSARTDYHQFLENAVIQLKDQQFQVNNREIIIQLIESLIDSNRIQGFKQSRRNDNSKDEERQFINRFTKILKWEYFNIYQASMKVGQSLISIPLSNDFQKLSEKDKKGFQSAVQQKGKSYQSLKEVLSAFINNFIMNFNKVVDDYERTGIFEPNYFSMPDAFKKVEEFLKLYDDYNSTKTVKVEFKPNYENPSLVATIKAIQLGFQQTRNSNLEDIMQFTEKMKKISQIYTTLFKMCSTFCSSQEEQLLLTRLNYVLQRGLIQCSNLYKLKEQMIHGVIFSLSDAILRAFDMNLRSFLDIFINRMSSDLMAKAFSSFQSIEEYEELLENYENNFKEEVEDKMLISSQRCSICVTKAELYLKKGQKIFTLQSLDKVIRGLEERIFHLTESLEEEQVKLPQLKSLYMTKRKTALKMVNILREIKKTETFDPLPFALDFCKEMKFSKDACEIYETIINSTEIPLKDRSQMCVEYANSLIQWGFLDKAFEALTFKQSIETDDYERYEESKKMIAEFEQKRETYREDFRNLMKSWKEESFSNMNLLRLLDDINANIPQEKSVLVE